MALNEIQRQAYLEAMGIQSYFPRYVLPGALPSRQCHWPAPVRPRRSEAPPETPSTAPAADLKAGLDTPPARPRPAARQPAQQTAPSVPSRPMAAAGADAGGEAIRFRLAILQADGLCALCELPETGPDHLGAGPRRLLFNLLAWLGLAREQAQLDEWPFHWPFAESEYLDKRVPAARAALHAHLQQRQARHGFDTVLLLGRRLAPCLVAETGAAPGPGAQQGQEGKCWRSGVTDSLQAMLEDPARKRQVWRELRPLRNALRRPHG